MNESKVCICQWRSETVWAIQTLLCALKRKKRHKQFNLHFKAFLVKLMESLNRIHWSGIPGMSGGFCRQVNMLKVTNQERPAVWNWSRTPLVQEDQSFELQHCDSLWDELVSQSLVLWGLQGDKLGPQSDVGAKMEAGSSTSLFWRLDFSNQYKKYQVTCFGTLCGALSRQESLPSLTCWLWRPVLVCVASVLNQSMSAGCF